MRLFPILTAALVCVSLYLLIIERPALLAFASGERAERVEQVAAAPASSDTLADMAEVAEERAVAVVAKRSVAQSIDTAVRVRGRTEAARQVDVRAETSGLVMSEPLRRGAEVAVGDVLCELSPGTRGAMLAEAEARLAEAQINFRAADQLSQGGFGSETRTAQARAALQSAEAAVESAQKEIERLTIRAPFDGLLESDAAETGALLQPGGHCATIIQLDPIKLVGFVAETEVGKITVGAMAGARLATGRDVTGQVTFLSRAADPATRTFRVDVTVRNTDLSIRDGQTAEILIATEGVSAHLVPSSALTLDDGGRLGLRVVDESSRARFNRVSVLRDTVEGVWVTGLPDEAAIIVVGQEYVTDGVPVIPTWREAGQ
jgi:membrane fusion protein, multidrug efflux system